jgi:Xaa-Pro dipeptidase
MTDANGPLPDLSLDERRTIVARRLEAVGELLDQHDAAGVLLSSRRDFSWLTVGGLNHVVLASESGVAPVLVTGSGAVVLTPVNEAARIADEEVHGLPLPVEEVPWWDPAAIERTARQRLGRGRLLEEAAVAPAMTALRERLSGVEHARLAWLGRLARRVVDSTLAGCDDATTEEALAAAAVGGLAAAGARCPVILVAADDRIDRFRHPLPTERLVEQRVMLVVVAERWGVHAALTGMRELDAPSAELERRNDAVRRVLSTMRDATQPGRTLGDVLDAARARYAELGFPDEWRLHHQGGTIGYQGRERIATPADATVIAPGMAFAWNPSVRGAKAEETLYLDTDGTARIVTD